MRLLLSAESFGPGHSGLVTAVRSQLEGLVNLGFDCAVVVPSGSGANEWSTGSGVKLIEVPSVRDPFGSNQRGVVRLKARVTELLIRSFRPDVVHVHGPVVLGRIVARSARSAGIPVVSTVHIQPENLTQDLPQWFPVAPTSWLVGRIIWSGHKYSNVIVSPTRFADGVARRQLQGHRRAKFCTISNGVDTNFWRAGGLHEQGPTGRTIYVGRLGREKEIPVLFEAHARLLGYRPDMRLAIVGDGPQSRELHDVSRKLGGDSVDLTGVVSRDELRRLLRSSDVFCMPSPVELQCYAVLEALACGLPVVAANAGALPEMLARMSAARLFSAGDSQSCADALQLLHSLDGDRRQLASADCRARAEAHDLSTTALLLEELYLSLLS